MGLMTDGEVGSLVGTERGLQRMLMFPRSPLQNANCSNAVAQAKKWKHCQVVGQAATELRNLLSSWMTSVVGK